MTPFKVQPYNICRIYIIYNITPPPIYKIYIIYIYIYIHAFISLYNIYIYIYVDLHATACVFVY